MNKTALKKLAEEAIPLLQKMFGEGMEFTCTEYFKSNDTLTGRYIDRHCAETARLLQQSDGMPGQSGG